VRLLLRGSEMSIPQRPSSVMSPSWPTSRCGRRCSPPDWRIAPDRLFLSRHTGKSQIWSRYRKLGVHTRGGAVTRAQELGLLETW